MPLREEIAFSNLFFTLSSEVVGKFVFLVEDWPTTHT